MGILDFIYTGETEVREDNLENLLSTASKLKVKGLTESQTTLESEAASIHTNIEESSKKPHVSGIRKETPKAAQTTITPSYQVQENTTMEIKAEEGETESSYSTTPKVTRTGDPMDISSFLSPQEQQQFASELAQPYPKAPAVVNEPTQGQDYISNKNELERQCSELMVSTYDSSVGKTVWQCAQCHYSSKLRYTVKEHVETHISGFSHQCPLCDKSCNTRNALRVHTIRKHSNKVQIEKQLALL